MAAKSSRKMGEVDHEQYLVELLIQQGRCRLKRFEANTCHRIYFANCNKFIGLQFVFEPESINSN